MDRFLNRLVAALVGVFVLFSTSNAVSANPIGDFFKRIGNSITHSNRKPPPKTTKKNAGKPAAGHTPTPLTSASASPQSSVANSEPETTAAPPPTPTPMVVRVAGAVPANNIRRDVPYGVPVPGKAGFVSSPYAPNSGLVDVRGFASGTEVKDPYTGKIFLTP